jgi:HK97 gp10 family phage protein
MAGFQVNFKVPELKDALSKLSAYDSKTAAKIEDAVSTSTKAIARGARKRVPIRTGDLKKSVTSRFDKNRVVGTVAAREPYAHLVEFGHKGPAPAGEHPYMRPAFEDERPNLVRNIAQAVKP